MGFFIGRSAFPDDASGCGEPPASVDVETKTVIDGQADILFKRLGRGELKAQIETSKRDILLKYPNAEHAMIIKSIFVAECTAACLIEKKLKSYGLSKRISPMRVIQRPGRSLADGSIMQSVRAGGRARGLYTVRALRRVMLPKIVYLRPLSSNPVVFVILHKMDLA